MRITRIAAVLALCLLAAGCAHSWEPQYGPVPQTAAANQGQTVRLILKQGGTQVEMKNMRVEGDSLVGESGSPQQRVAVAADDVQVITVARREGDSTASTLIKTAGVVAIVLILAGVWLTTELFEEF